MRFGTLTIDFRGRQLLSPCGNDKGAVIRAMKIPLIFLGVILMAINSSFGFYNPKVGRWTTRDPLGEEDSANLYQFVGNNPVKNIDPLGMYTLGDAEDSLNKKGVPKAIHTWHGDRYSDEQLFNEWLALERSRGAWWKDLPKCPSRICIRKDGTPVNPDPSTWLSPKDPGANRDNHPGAVYEMRSKPVGHYSNQCIYDSAGNLMTVQPSAGTVDFYSMPKHWWNHGLHDWYPFIYARGLNRISDYYSVRPSW